MKCEPTGSSTLPRPTTKVTEADLIRSDKPATAASTTSLYDNVAPGNQGQNQQGENTSCSRIMNSNFLNCQISLIVQKRCNVRNPTRVQ